MTDAQQTDAIRLLKASRSSLLSMYGGGSGNELNVLREVNGLLAALGEYDGPPHMLGDSWDKADQVRRSYHVAQALKWERELIRHGDVDNG